MPGQIPVYKSLSETTVNTLKTEKVEIIAPGAKMLVLDTVFIEVDAPEGIAATLTQVKAAIAVGDCEQAITAAADVLASTPGVVALASPKMYGAGVCTMQTALEFYPKRAIPKTADGKYYITVAIKGTANVAVKSVRISASCIQP